MNYGHTVGHALEVMSGYRISHGEAVTVGMIVVNELSRRMRLLGAARAKSLEQSLLTLLAPGTRRELGRLKMPALASLLMKDKKTQGKKANFAFIEDLGRTKMVPVEIDARLCAQISGIIRKI
jgi:3-dehydroquinate synthase